MTTITPVLSPTHDAAEALRRLLALIDSLHTESDLTPDQITRFSGVTMTDVSTSTPSYEGMQPLTQIWAYEYEFVVTFDTKRPAVRFRFSEIDEMERLDTNLPDPAMTDICKLDLAQFHDALLGMGFHHVSSIRGRGMAQQYQRGLAYVEIEIEGESEEHVTHDCIKDVSLRFLDK